MNRILCALALMTGLLLAGGCCGAGGGQMGCCDWFGCGSAPMSQPMPGPACGP